MEYSLWEEAATLVLFIVSATESDHSQRSQWLPVTLIDHLLIALKTVMADKLLPVPQKEKLTQLNNDIQSSLAHYQQVLKDKSK
jgi:hypothetical protein